MKELNKKFKNQFKLSFIKSLELGFSIDRIKKRLKKQSYPSDLINNLIEELKSDKDIVNLIKPQKQNFLKKVKDIFFKISETTKIQKTTKIHSLHYNLIIDQKRKLCEKYNDINEILDNIENKKLINNFIKIQETYIKTIQKKINKILKTAKTLANIELKKDVKNKINKILEYIQMENLNLNKELKNLKNLKVLIKIPEELKQTLQRERNYTKEQETNLQKEINEISKKSSKFKEVISQL